MIHKVTRLKERVRELETHLTSVSDRLTAVEAILRVPVPPKRRGVLDMARSDED